MKYLLTDEELNDLKQYERKGKLLDKIKMLAIYEVEHGSGCRKEKDGYCSDCVIGNLTPYIYTDIENGKCLAGLITYYSK